MGHAVPVHLEGEVLQEALRQRRPNGARRPDDFPPGLLLKEKTRKLHDVLRAVWFAHRKFPARPAFTLLDVGARSGLQPKWSIVHRLGFLNAILVEPDREEARRLEESLTRLAVVPYALGDSNGESVLNVTRNPGRSSLLEPNIEIAGEFGDAEAHQVVERQRVQLRRFDSLAVSSEVTIRQPDFVKIDVQGYELNVLEGLGGFLEGVLCLEIETSLLPFYKDQPLFQDVYEVLRRHGFGLVAYRPLGLANDEIVVANALFSKRATDLDPQSGDKIRFWHRIMSVPGHHQYVMRCH